MKKLYIAYGSNMNIKQMAMRCPKATPLGKYILEDYKLEFRGVANIIESKGARTPVAIWSITESCERSLDRYEGYPRLYRKEYIKLKIKGKEEIGMVYVMNIGKIAEPSEHYYNVIKQGYKDFHIQTMPLEIALAESQGAEIPPIRKRPPAYNRKLTAEQETELLAPFKERAEKGEKVTRQEIQKAYEEKTKEPTHKNTMYDMLKRNNWHRVIDKSKNNYWKPNDEEEES